jgi:hypothetical protein
MAPLWRKLEAFVQLKVHAMMFDLPNSAAQHFEFKFIRFSRHRRRRYHLTSLHQKMPRSHRYTVALPTTCACRGLRRSVGPTSPLLFAAEKTSLHTLAQKGHAGEPRLSPALRETREAGGLAPLSLRYSCIFMLRSFALPQTTQIQQLGRNQFCLPSAFPFVELLTHNATASFSFLLAPPEPSKYSRANEFCAAASPASDFFSSALTSTLADIARSAPMGNSLPRFNTNVN